jgi:hypothetical protein
MASHPAMLLDPKGAKRRAQSNGNIPNSSSPAYDFSPMDSPNVPSETPKDSFELWNHSSDPTLPHSPGLSSSDNSPALLTDLSSPVHFPLPSMDTAKNNPVVLEEASTEAEASVSAVPQTDSPVKSADVLASVEDHVLSPQMETEVLSGNDAVSAYPPVNPDLQDGDIAMFDELPRPDVPCVDSATQIDISAMAANTVDPTPNLPSYDLSYPVASPVLVLMSTDEPESSGLLLEGTGKHNGNRAIPVSPMAPAGTATVSRFREPTTRTPSAVNSGASTPAPQASSNMTVQFTTANNDDDDNESDAKRSHREISDDEDSFDRRNLISNVYGVEDRKRQPVKRIKTASEQASAANTPVTISGDSGIGRWMKEGEEKPASVSTVSDVVDLTAGKIFDFSPPSAGRFDMF